MVEAFSDHGISTGVPDCTTTALNVSLICAREASFAELANCAFVSFDHRFCELVRRSRKLHIAAVVALGLEI